MKFIPILFSTPMVQAITAGRKTQTRRALKLSRYHPRVTHKQPEVMTVKDLKLYDGNGDLEGDLIMRYGKPGDVFWVRETFAEASCLFKGSSEFSHYVFKADKNPLHDNFKWKPAIHMPKAACRIFLKIKDIRVERLQDISESDAIAEGIKPTWIHDNPKRCKYKNYIDNGRGSLYAQDSFFSLWESINGKESLELNPWVWVIEFEKIEKPEGFV